MFRFSSTSICLALIAAALTQRDSIILAAPQQGSFKVQIVADDMCCNGCAQKVAAQLYAAPGVTTVEADVPSHTITITAKPSPKLTLGRLWHAVEQGKGGPSKLVTAQATYTLTRPDSLKPEQRLTAGHYSLVVREMRDQDGAQQLANQLYTIRGVKNVSSDVAQRALFVESEAAALLSPWSFVAAVEQANNEAIIVAGPYGVLSVERSAAADPATAARPNYPQAQGGVR